MARESHILTEAQLAALEKAKVEKEAYGEVESECPGYCGAQDTCDAGTLKGVGRIYQQTFIDTYSKVGFATLYDRKTSLTAADLLNDQMVPFFDAHEVPLIGYYDQPDTEEQYHSLSDRVLTSTDDRRPYSLSDVLSATAAPLGLDTTALLSVLFWLLLSGH